MLYSAIHADVLEKYTVREITLHVRKIKSGYVKQGRL